MPTTIEGIEFYKIPEVAEAFKVTPQTIRTWIKQGKLKSQRIGRLTKENIKEFLDKKMNG